MTAKTTSPLAALLCGCAVSLGACTYSRPPQTEFYCVSIPEGGSAQAGQFIRTIAARLDFKVSEAAFPAEKGPPQRAWETYGRGVSIFFNTAANDRQLDADGNISTTFNPNHLSFIVAKTGLWQRVGLEEVVATVSDSAHRLGWQVSKKVAGQSCAN